MKTDYIFLKLCRRENSSGVVGERGTGVMLNDTLDNWLEGISKPFNMTAVCILFCNNNFTSGTFRHGHYFYRHLPHH